MMEEVPPTQDHHDVTMMQSRTQTNQIHGCSLSMIETLWTRVNSKMTIDAVALLRYYYSPSSLGDQLYQQLSVPFAADDSTVVVRPSRCCPLFSSEGSLLF
jgi:hypothetical protein